MAAPAPYWKRKTRPCPFYSQGRCLFSDACNFVHSVKVNNETAVHCEDYAHTDGDGELASLTDTISSVSVSALKRNSSGSRRSSVKSPPRSPRLSGLLSALADVIGPDEEELGEEDEEDRGRTDDTRPERIAENEAEASDFVETSRYSPSCLPYLTNTSTDETRADEIWHLSPVSNHASAPGNNTSPELTSPTASQRDSPRLPVLLPIVTQQPSAPNSTILDDNTIEIADTRPPELQEHLLNSSILNAAPGSRCQSMLGFYSTSYTSPAMRILSPQISPVISPIFGSFSNTAQGVLRSTQYTDDDVASLSTPDSSGPEEISSEGPSKSAEKVIQLGQEDDNDRLMVAMSSYDEAEEALNSPHETERPNSEYFRTPRNALGVGDLGNLGLEDLPALPPLAAHCGGEDFGTVNTAIGFRRELRASGAYDHKEVGVLSKPAIRHSDGSSCSVLDPFPRVDLSFSTMPGGANDSTSPGYIIDESPASITSLTVAPEKEARALVETSEPGNSSINSLNRSESSVAFPCSPSIVGARKNLAVSSPRPSRGGKAFNEVNLTSSKVGPTPRKAHNLAQISTAFENQLALSSPPDGFLGPSPSSLTQSSETMVDSDGKEELEEVHSPTNDLESQISRLSLMSPIKALLNERPISEGTVRVLPSSLHEEAPRPASSMSSSSSRLSWAEFLKKDIEHKVPFGFRHSVNNQSSPNQSHGTSSVRNSVTSQFMAARRQSFSAANGQQSTSAILDERRPSSPSICASRRDSVSSLREFPRRLLRSASQIEFGSNRIERSSPIMGGSEPSLSRRPTWMRPLRLSQNADGLHSTIRSPFSGLHLQRFSTASHVRNVSQASSVNSISHSSTRSSLISAYINDSQLSDSGSSLIDTHINARIPLLNSSTSSASQSLAISPEQKNHRRFRSTGTDVRHVCNPDLLSPLSGSMRGLEFEDLSFEPDYATNDGDKNELSSTSLKAIIEEAQEPSTIKSVPVSVPDPCHAIATPRPTLIFAIAGDNPAEVEHVLASGQARVHDDVGPQSPLEFALTNDQLVNKTDIVKILLAYGADPKKLPADLHKLHAVTSPGRRIDPATTNEEATEAPDATSGLPSGAVTAANASANGSASSPTNNSSPGENRESMLNPAMKYYLNRATTGPQAAQMNAALRRSDFRPLARMRFDFVGQDRALEHLYWVLGMHSQQPIGTPLVVLCCGPSGSGKSLLARKFGSLLDVPTHTVNMTVLKTPHDLWQCPTMSPYDQPSEHTLAEFLEDNAGKRCVVVLDEIDKNADERTLWSLLAPWELGRCSIDAGRRHIDMRNVIWIGTSNIGQGLVFENHAARTDKNAVISKTEYRELMNTLRPTVTERLGTSLMSRVTTVLPFVPFTHDEKLAIATEAVLALGGEDAAGLPTSTLARIAAQCVREYVETDGARSLYRSVSTILMEEGPF